MTNIFINNVAIYHPKKLVSNDFYHEHFQKNSGKDISHFMEVMGRKDRYLIDNEKENGLTMGIEASKKVLAKSGLAGTDIDMIVFSTQIPETTFPTNSMNIHHAIEAGHETITMDSNANCAGMTLAVEQASRYMMSNPRVNRALIVGSDYNSLISDPQDAMTYANYGDAAAAVILEKTDTDTGFIDSAYYCDSVQRDMIRYPAQGLANAVRGNGDDKYIQWLPFDGAIALPPAYKMIDALLTRNNLTSRDIKAYCLSQYALVNIKRIQEHFQLDDNQIVYVGDRFGYTGTSSPFIALHEGIESGQISRGDYVVFWTVGAGFELTAMLFKY
ncbi:3-oxoacyl-[acyl-carrier-protein] synthase III C-terminal domain-containing protein [Bacillus massiliglaciei]|uniref:3-oxoacyl-[acyl-carrier-protein] synthase III C-terminal domain-containing protein n=1 Tax=Bacillus massiliglaciei TaxID=1816693 RepID=UPI000AB7B934|nr:3-oxoacyl-[acyl-carrier-protein] synthase III C-terminal domain-containing protein [Bacillus massiliglaciei]